MDEDDPEKRISELERHLAAPRTAGRPGSLTPELVRNVAFAKPPIGKRGYNEDEVDAFLDLVEAALRDPAGRPLTPQQVRDVAFAKPPIGKRGYNEDEVDAFLDLVGEHLQPAGAPPPVDRPTARHTGGESWPRRVVNAVIQFFAWVAAD